jgi:uncharacterized protein
MDPSATTAAKPPWRRAGPSRASLVEATGSRITEVRITRLLAPVFYATVLVQSPAGLQEVDSRPSDAVNLALAAGAPIRVDTGLFSLDHHLEELPSYPVATASLAAQAQKGMQAIRSAPPRTGQ